MALDFTPLDKALASLERAAVRSKRDPSDEDNAAEVYQAALRFLDDAKKLAVRSEHAND